MLGNNHLLAIDRADLRGDHFPTVDAHAGDDHCNAVDRGVLGE